MYCENGQTLHLKIAVNRAPAYADVIRNSRSGIIASKYNRKLHLIATVLT